MFWLGQAIDDQREDFPLAGRQPRDALFNLPPAAIGLKALLGQLERFLDDIEHVLRVIGFLEEIDGSLTAEL